MQPLKIIIPGSFWDSYLYTGNLYLFLRDGSIQTIDWQALIKELIDDPYYNLVMEWAFLDSNYLYGELLKSIFEDNEVKDLLIEKFRRASTKEFVVENGFLSAHGNKLQENKFPFPHADATFHYNNIFIGSRSGVHYASCSGSTKYGISTRIHKTTDIPTHALAASYKNLAIAAGEDGLFQIPVNINDYNRKKTIKEFRLSNNIIDDCQWTFYSIYGSSHLNNGVMASFVKDYDEHQKGIYERKFSRLIFDEEIFEHSGYSWGTQDKLYQSAPGRVRVVKYTPWQKDSESNFTNLGEIELASWKGGVISGDTALFGTVIECEEAIVVVLSNDKIFTFPGEPVNWRVFPRSKNYENQLHIVYEDRIEILSFNHDYFVDQYNKKAGTSFINWRKRRF